MKYVYAFREGNRDQKYLLGGKGANLAEMTNLGVPVPPGFTIACAVCIEYLGGGKISDALRADVTKALRRLEETTGKKFGDPKAPLLVSVRSGAPVSMPGMMETILDIGLNDESVLGLAAHHIEQRTVSILMFVCVYRRGVHIPDRAQPGCKVVLPICVALPTR